MPLADFCCFGSDVAFEFVAQQLFGSDEARSPFRVQDIEKSDKEQKDTEEEIASSAALIEECKEVSRETSPSSRGVYPLSHSMT